MKITNKRITIMILLAAVVLSLLVGAVAFAASTPTVKIELTNLSIRQNVAIKYAVKVANLPSGATVGISVKKGSPDAAETYEATFDQIAEIDGTEYYIFSVDCLSAAEMAVDVYATPYVKSASGSNLATGAEKKSSVLKYAYMACGKIDGGRVMSEDVQTLLSSMLEYGAAVQNYVGFNTDRLANDKYYRVELTDGTLADGHTSGLYKSGETVTMTADTKTGKIFDGWKNSSGTVVSESEKATVTVGSKNEIYTAVYSSDTSVISYVVNGGTLPSGSWNDYTPGTAFTLPTPTRSGYAFSGWFTSSDFAIENIVSEIPKTATGAYTLYAKWNKIISEQNAAALSGNAFNNNDVSANNIATSGGKLIWSQGTGIASQLDLRNFNLATKLGGETTVTYKVTLSKVAGYDVSSANLRMRRAGGNSYIQVFSTDNAGNVYLGGNTAYKITTLTEAEQTISIAVDFAEGVMVAYNGRGAEITRYYFPLPSGDTGSYTYKSWLSAITYYGWLWYSNASKVDTKLAVSNVSIYAGDSAIRTAGNGYTLDELKTLVSQLKATNSAFTKAQFDTTTSSLTTSSSLSMTATTKWGTAYKNYLPTARTGGTGARLMLNSSVIKNLLSTIENPEYAHAYRALVNIANSDVSGILPAAYEHTSGRKGIHNYDNSVLGAIEAKAFMYRLMYEQGCAAGSIEAYERDKYGYEAIIAIKNYLRTLDIQYITSDQCREYGYVMFIAAEVYDWCYPLLTASDKEQIIFGVVESCCSGKCGYPSYTSSSTYQQKMEVGFPPAGQGSVSGHGSEAQILRDYLSFAIAIYDEDPSWYNYVGQRVIGDYVAVRNVYFASGMTQQGVSNYVAHRHYFDLYSAWLLKTATGKNPYVGLENTLTSIISYQLPNGERLFSDGDGTGMPKLSSYARHALFSSAIYSDLDTSDTLFTWFADINGVKSFSTGGPSALTYPTFMILASEGQKRVTDKYAELDLILYNGSPLGQLISRSEWNNENAAATFMKIKERNTANHEHDDAGTFLIYYKGMLTGDSGVYNGYGNAHHQSYHQATVAHNGLLIVDTTNTSTTYSGGQRSPGEAQNLTGWNDSAYDTGKVTGVQYGYKDAAKTKAQYAYIAGDITASYESTQASYVGRRMLTVYTDDANFPMYFFVYDNITAANASYKKTFLLHINGVNEPTVSGNVVTTVNGDGKLVLHSLTDGATITKVGGRAYTADGKYDADKSKNYLINGVNCKTPDGVDDGNWGRVEISVTGSLSNDLLNAMYVTDATGTATAPKVSKVTATGVKGAVVGNVAAIFSTDKVRTASALSFTVSGSGNVNYYVSGVAEGEWKISVNGTSYGTATATNEGGLLTFTAPAGSVTLTPVGLLYENYSTSVVDTTVNNTKVTVNGITYQNTDYTVCKFTTVKDSSGNYVLTETTNGAQIRASGNLYEKLGSETSVSYVFKLAKVSGKTPLTYSFRIRDAKTGNNYKEIFTVDTSGNVKLGGTTTVTTLGTSFKTLRFVVDFAAGKILFYSDNGAATSVSFTPPKNTNSSAASTSEWLTYVTGLYFDCQAYLGNGSIKIGEIGVFKGNVFD